MIEIERKFLLRKLPNIQYDDILMVDQFYRKNKTHWDRYRKLHSITTNDIKYQHTIKKTISKGINEEIECYLTEEEFIINLSKCFLSKTESKKLNKIRHIFNYTNGLKWEIDVITDTDIIIAEIEIPSLDYDLILPNYITDNLICEVTNQKEFSNRNISQKITKPKSKINNKIKKSNVKLDFL